jgi:hypothetical protein
LSSRSSKLMNTSHRGQRRTLDQFIAEGDPELRDSSGFSDTAAN